MLAFAAGILASEYAGLSLGEAAAGGACTAALAVAAYCLKARRGALAALLAAAGFVGASFSIQHRPGPPPQMDAQDGDLLLLDGCVVEPPVFSPDRGQFVLELEPGARARVTVPLQEGDHGLEFGYGRRVQFEAKVRRPRNFGNPGTFDYVRYLARRNIYWTASVPRGTPITVLEDECGSPLKAIIYELRVSALNRIETLYPGDSYAQAMTKAVLIGDSTNLERVWVEQFRRTGTYHALVISGLHVVVLAGTLYRLLRWCFISELLAGLLAAIGVWVYAAVTGGSPPAVRAAGGFTLYLVGRHMYRRGRILNLLAVVAVVYLALDPYQIFDASFQLSFLSVAAIGAFAEPITRAVMNRVRKAGQSLGESSWDAGMEPRQAEFRVELRLLIEMLALWTRIPARALTRACELAMRGLAWAGGLFILSAVMQIALALPMAVYFHRISVSGLTANLVVTPLMSLMVPVGFAAIFTGFGPVAWLAHLLLDGSASVARWHTQFEPAHRIPDPPVWAALLLVASLVLAAAAIRLWPRLRWAVLGGAFAAFGLVFAAPFEPLVPRGTLELTAIDVGQGEALLITTPERYVLLVDAGGIPVFGRARKPRLEIGEDVVSPYLWRRRIQRVDAIAMTHAHEDHIGGLAALVENFNPAEIWTGAVPEGSPGTDVLNRARQRGVRVLQRNAGEAFSFGGVDVEVLSPAGDYQPRDKPHNDDSLVLRLRFGEHSFLLTGDMERQAEWSLIDRGVLTRTTVLKVAHHGSRSSTLPEFLEATRPTFAIISAGYGNLFRHPHPELLERLEAHKTAILRTDQSGLITIRSDGRRLSVQTGTGEAGRSPWDPAWNNWAE
jgi:competence protein ComEC